MADTPSKEPRCPICGKPSAHKTRPFCSRRCADIDLSRWLKGVYRVPAEEGPGPNGAEGPPGEESDA